MKYMLSSRSVFQSLAVHFRVTLGFLSGRSRLPKSLALAKLRPFALLALCAFGLVACGGDKAVISKDRSVDYRTARSLPPLIKTLPAAETPVVAATSVAVTSPMPSSPEERDTAQPDLARSYAPTVIATESLASAQIDATDAQPAAESAIAVSSSIITTADNTARLLVAAPLNTAWSYVIAQARASDLSIFSRNVADARMFIGCKGIPQAGSVKKAGRWTFFNRDKPDEAAQYCSLKLQEQGSQTLVSVLDTSGNEVDAAFGESILSSLLE